MNRKLACVTLDVEADLGNSQGRIRLFDEPSLLERYLRILKKYDVRVTAFLVTSLLARYEGALRGMAEQIPVEFGLHSHHHDPRTGCDRREIRTAMQAYQAFAGEAPVGFRAPIGSITRDGLNALMDYGFRYDSSVYPSIRPGRNGYWNPHLPIVPFRVVRGDASILELPFTALPVIRLVFALSYVKLLGWHVYAALMRRFPLPDLVVFLSHPHDFYRPKFDDGVTWLEKRAILRNASRAFEYLEHVLQRLKAQGYRFVHASEMCEHLQGVPDLRVMHLATWR